MISSDSSDSNEMIPPTHAPMFNDDDSDTSDEWEAIQRARSGATELDEHVPMKLDEEEDCIGGVTSNTAIVFSFDDEDDSSSDCNMLPPESYIKQEKKVISSPVKIEKVKIEEGPEKVEIKEVEMVDYSGVFDEAGNILNEDIDEEDGLTITQLREKRKRGSLFNLKRKKKTKITKEYEDVKADKRAIKGADIGIAKLLIDEKKQLEQSDQIYQAKQEEMELDKTERQRCINLNEKLERRNSFDDISTQLLNIATSRRLPVKTTHKAAKIVKAKPRAKQRLVNKIPSISNGTKSAKSPVMETGLSISTTRPGDINKANALSAADALEKAALATPVAAPKGRTIVNRRRKTVTNAPEIIRRYGDITRMIVILHVWRESKYTPKQDDRKVVEQIINGANVFIKMAKELGDNLAKLCNEYFDLHNNTAMKQVIKGLRENTHEVHERPTVRKIPSKKAIDAWSGQLLDETTIKQKASLVMRPINPEDSATCTLVTPKEVPAFLAVLHGAFHLEKYIRNYIKDAVETVEELSPTMSWKQVWEKCAGRVLSEVATFKWPKGTKSKNANAFTNIIISGREHIIVILYIQAELKAEIEKQKERIRIEKE